jgi:hypothetical protein
MIMQQLFQHLGLLVGKAPAAPRQLRQARPQHLHTRCRCRELQARRAVVRHRLLDHQHRPLARQPRQQVLRALQHEVPAQVAEDDQVAHEVS